MDRSPNFRPLTLADVEPAARVITQAFWDDPLIGFMLPSKKTRITTLLCFFRVYGEISIRNRRGYGVGDPLQGIAFWKGPNEEGLSVDLKTMGKLLPLLFSQYTIGYLRGRSILKQIDLLHAKHAEGPHYYLDNLGVLPSAQGQGYSSRLIRPVLAWADGKKVIVYTDTVTPSNVPFYEHFGFECVEARPVAGTGLTVFALRRPISQTPS